MMARGICRLLARLIIEPNRKPDFVIGNQDDPYMKRWFIIPRNKIFNIYLHHIIHSDDDRALHDHPWWSVSFCLRGRMQEYFKASDGYLDARTIWAGSVVGRSANFAHRLIIRDDSPGCWTLFITGPVIRQWGFHCPQGWRHWKEFTSPNNKGEVGRGCD